MSSHPTPRDDLQALLDERAIREVLARYCRGVDRLDEALIRSCYHPDATDDHGMYRGSGEGFAKFCVEALRAHAAATLHVLGQSTVELDGDRARVESYVVAHHRCEPEEGTVLETVGARYVDRFERRDGAWRIADRRVLVDWEKRERTERVFPEGTFASGERSRRDPSYGDA